MIEAAPFSPFSISILDNGCSVLARSMEMRMLQLSKEKYFVFSISFVCFLFSS